MPDESTDGLDPSQKYGVRRLINEMVRDRAIVISTHILEEIEGVADLLIVPKFGQQWVEPLHELIRFSGLAVDSLVVEQGSMDDISRELTMPSH
ncbi:MAG: hypothetical protein WAS21_29580 [Geminicoccaceae bacterium]